jgi:alpha-mannosidase
MKLHNVDLFSLLISCLLSFSFSYGQKPGSSQEPPNEEPMYMLTYDHGGLILWGTDHFEERMDNAIEWLEKYPGFKIGLDNEAYVYDYLSEDQPHLLLKIQDYLKSYKGRFAIGSCTYGQPLSTFIGEESNIRQIGFALEANLKYFGYENKIYLMSEHAMHAQIPQILKGFGFEGAIMRTHFMMYGYNPTYNEPFGWWIGMDGSRIPTVPTYTGEGAAFGRTPVDNWILTRYPGQDAKISLNDFRQQFRQINPLLATRADDSDLRKEALVKEYNGNRSFHWVLLDDLLSIYPEPKAEFMTKPDDFTVRMPWGYCGNEIWDRTRETEVQLLTTERLATIGYLINGKNHEQELEQSWKHLLLAQHHDIQIVGLLPDARQHLDISYKGSSQVQHQVLEDIAENMRGDGVRQVLVFNPLSWDAQQWIRTKVQFKRGEAKDVAVYYGNEKVSAEILEANRFSSGYIMDCEIIFQAKVDPLGLKIYNVHPLAEIEPAEKATFGLDQEKLIIHTPFYEVQLSENGGISSLKNKITGEQVFKTGIRSGFLAGVIDGEECESNGKWVISKVNPGSPWITATEYGFIADIPYSMKLMLNSTSPQLDWKVTVELDSQRIGQLSDNQRESVSPFIHEKKLRFKFYPALNHPLKGVRDLPFVIAETSDQYIQGNYWTSVEDELRGLAVFNKGTMCLVNETDGGNSIPLVYAMYYIWGTRMLGGKYEYEFAQLPYSGNWNEADIHKKAIAYNFPFISYSCEPQHGTDGPQLEIFRIKSDQVVLSALYVDNGRVYARMYDYSGNPGEAEITDLLDHNGWIETDLLGEKVGEVKKMIEFVPWQIKTLEWIR